MRSLSFLAVLACGLLPGQENLPDGPGNEALQRACSSCHEIEAVIASRRTRIGWQLSVDDMISRGAEGSDAEMAAIVEYLTRHFGKVNVNTASAEELEKTLGLSAKEAQAIYAYRQKNEKVKDFEELKKIAGVDPEQMQAKRGLIAFTQ